MSVRSILLAIVAGGTSRSIIIKNVTSAYFRINNPMAEIGRPTIMTPETISKLEEIFSLGGSDEEACFFAGIGKSTLYNYQKECPEFVERKEALKETPILKARRTVIKSLEEPNHAFRFLERKKRGEFGPTLDISGEVTSKVISVDE